MAITVEDGSIVAGADSWITVSEWEAYCTSYGRTVAGTTADKEVMVRKAQRAISTRVTLLGDPVDDTQTTALPRYWGRMIKGFWVESTEIPQDIKDAQAEMAWAIHEGSDPFADKAAATVGAITGSRAKAGPVETDTSYTAGGTAYDPRDMTNYTAAYALLRPYVSGSPGQIRMGRG